MAPTGRQSQGNQRSTLTAEFAQDRYRGALLGVAVGDALGAPFEGHPGPVSHAVLVRHLESSAPATYTDDTALTLATAESVLACSGLDEDHLAGALAANYSAEPHRGYGRGTASLLARITAGADWKDLAPAQFDGTGSFGNGAAMRITPVALLAAGHVARSAALARQAARTTHTHPIGVEGAAVLAAAVALALGEAPAETFPHELQVLADESELTAQLWAVAGLAPGSTAVSVASTTGTGISASESVPAAIACFCLHPDSFVDAVSFAISLGGDTDTIASMTGAIAGARHGYSALPDHWVTRTEGHHHLLELADHLASRFAPAPQHRGPRVL